MTDILLSDLALTQLKEMPATTGRQLLDVMERLRTFPESSPPLSIANYETYRQIIVQPYRAIYRYDPNDDLVRVYCIMHVRRQLPPSEFLTHQIF